MIWTQKEGSSAATFFYRLIVFSNWYVPTGSLDENNKQEIFSLLKQLQASGKTIVVVTHDKELMEIADKVIVLEKADHAAKQAVA